MKFLHLADLHLGRRLGEADLLDDQRAILRQILSVADAERPDGVLIAGDVYDKSQPTADAVTLLDDFLTALAYRRLPTFLISGNHDSPERLNFGSRLLADGGIHIAGVFDGRPRCETLSDAYGPISVVMLPFLRPASARPFFPGLAADSDQPAGTDAVVRAALAAVPGPLAPRRVLLAHQFVTAGARLPERCDSESISVGGLDNVDVSAFDGFDYVALGHLHGPQRVGRDTVRYAGSPLGYSFSEARQHKSVTLVELRAKGDVSVRLVPLTPQRALREIRGPIERLLAAGKAQPEGCDDYLHATLTDEQEVYDALGKLREIYPNLLRLDYAAQAQDDAPSPTSAAGEAARRSPLELFGEFFENQNGRALRDDERRRMEQVLRQAGGDEQ